MKNQYFDPKNCNTYNIHKIYILRPLKIYILQTLPAFPGLPLDPPGSRPASSNLPQSPWCPKTSENHFNLMKTNENSMRINEKQWKSKKINENHSKINTKPTFSRPQPPPASPAFQNLRKSNENQRQIKQTKKMCMSLSTRAPLFLMGILQDPSSEVGTECRLQ